MVTCCLQETLIQYCKFVRVISYKARKKGLRKTVICNLEYANNETFGYQKQMNKYRNIPVFAIKRNTMYTVGPYMYKL